MKIQFVTSFFLLCAIAGALGQEQAKHKEPSVNFKFGISAGASLIDFASRAYVPSARYHVGVFERIALGDLEILASAQYFPMRIRFYDGYNFAWFKNHVLNFALMAKLPVAFNKRLTVGMGPSVAQGIHHQHSEHAEFSPGDYCGPTGMPIKIKARRFLTFGSSWRFTPRNEMSVLYHSPSRKQEERASAGPYILQATFSHTL
jgi:hypothetical protein